MSLDVKPELDSGFFICGAPVMVALLLMGELDIAEAAAGNVGLTGADVWAALKFAVGGADIVADDDYKYKKSHGINISLKSFQRIWEYYLFKYLIQFHLVYAYCQIVGFSFIIIYRHPCQTLGKTTSVQLQYN